MTATAPVFKPGRAWLVTILQILGSIGFGLGMYKAMTTMTLMITYFRIDFTLYGSLTGVISLCALITAIPGGLIMAKIGAKNLALTCLGLGCLGNLMPTILLLACGRETNFVLMTCLGIPSMLGWGAMSVAGTALVSAWFPPKKRPLPMGCCGMFASLSMLMVQFLSAPLIGMASYEGFTEEEIAFCYGQSPAGVVTVTVAFTIYITVVTILCFIFMKDPKPENSFLGATAADESAGGQGYDVGKSSDGFKNLGVWLCVIVFFCYSWCSMSYANYWPTYIESDPSMGGFSVEPVTANMFTTAVSYSMIAVSLVVGFLLTKINRGHWWILLLIVMLCICFNDVFMFDIPNAGWFIPVLIVYGCTSELWPIITYTLVPEFVDSPKALGAALGLVSFMLNITGTIANTINGIIVDNQVYMGVGWHALATPLRILAVVVIIAGVALIFTWRKRWDVLKARAAEAEAKKAAAPAAEA
jgi:MFS family permease